MRRAVVLIAACAAVAALSTLLPWALAFDPEAWLVWGRETARLELATAGGPSWKPLPVLVTTALSPLGDAAPWAWMVLARTAALLALAGAVVLARRLGGSGAAAAALIALSPWWAFHAAMGNSEGMLAAALLWAAWAELAGRRGAALALLTAACWLRPEAWPLLGLYALSRRPRGWLPALASVPVAWFVPELLSSGEPFRAAAAATGTPSAEAAANAAHPWLEVLRDAVELMTVPVALAAAVALVLASRARDRATLVLGAVAVGWVALVSAMTAAGFAGTPRYSAPAATGAAVLAAMLVRRAVPALVLVVLVAALQAGDLDAQRADLAARADLRDSLRQAIDAAGGADALRACAPVRVADRTRTTTVAWQLDVPILGLMAPPEPGDTVLRVVGGAWRVSSRCGP